MKPSIFPFWPWEKPWEFPSKGPQKAQDYITERVAHFLGIDLAELDPDGTGEEGGMRLGGSW